MVTGTVGLDGVWARAMGLSAPSDRAIQMAVWIFFILPFPLKKKTSRASQQDMGWRAQRTCSLLPVAGRVFLLTLPFIERALVKIGLSGSFSRGGRRCK